MGRTIMVISKVKSEKGFSLVELIVVTAIFVTVLIITGISFDTIVSKSGQEMKTAETQIEGAVGLEILRRDLAQAGYGLPWDLNGASYAEINSSDALMPGVDSAKFNDASGGVSNPPRAVVSSFDTSTAGFNGSDYLVVKSTITGISNTAKKWYNATFTHYTSSQMSSGERVIVLRNTYSTGSLANKALVNNSGAFAVSYPSDGTFPAAFRPDQGLDIFTVYGVAPPKSGETSLRMPFNRSDYYIKRPNEAYKIPQTFAQQVSASATQGVGILYRSTASQDSTGGGGFSLPYPLLDCVADMQVVYSLDTNGDGNVDLHSNTPLTTAAAVRAQVKEVRVYILAQEGKKSLNYTYPQGEVLVGERINGIDYGRVFIFSAHNIKDWSNYHWRLYTIVVPLGNLN